MSRDNAIGLRSRGTTGMTARRHKDVEYAVDDERGRERILKTFPDACAFAVLIAAAKGGRRAIDVRINSTSGARAWGGDEAVARYREDPEAAVFERLEVAVNVVGRVV